MYKTWLYVILKGNTMLWSDSLGMWLSGLQSNVQREKDVQAEFAVKFTYTLTAGVCNLLS